MQDYLSVIWNVNPILVKLGPVAIRYYSLLFIAGFPLGYYLFVKFFKREGVNPDLVEPFLYIVLAGTIIGARLGHCLFYEPSYYLANPIKILMVWEGGLASHGGAIALVLCILLYAHKYGRKNGFDAMWIFDRFGIVVCFAGMFIRLGNLFNSEIFGGATTLPWGFKFLRSYEWVNNYGPDVFPPEGVACHPTQIYEALAYLILGLILLWVYNKRSDRIYKGGLFGIFLIILFGMRFLIEFIKNDQVGFESGMLFNMGQLLSIPFVLAGVIILVVSYKRRIPTLLEPKNGVKMEHKPLEKSERMSRAKRKEIGKE